MSNNETLGHGDWESQIEAPILEDKRFPEW